VKWLTFVSSAARQRGRPGNSFRRCESIHHLRDAAGRNSHPRPAVGPTCKLQIRGGHNENFDNGAFHRGSDGRHDRGRGGFAGAGVATGAEPQYRVIRNAPKEVGRDDLKALFRAALSYW